MGRSPLAAMQFALMCVVLLWPQPGQVALGDEGILRFRTFGNVVTGGMMVINHQGTLYTAGRIGWAIQTWRSDGTFAGWWGNREDKQRRPEPARWHTPDEGDIWPRRGRWNPYTPADGSLENIAGIGLDSQDNLYVVDAEQARVLKFAAAGDTIQYLGWWGRGVASADPKREGTTGWHPPDSGQGGCPGRGDGQLDTPQSLTVDAQGNVWVMDRGEGIGATILRIQKFDGQGRLLGKLLLPRHFKIVNNLMLNDNFPDWSCPVGNVVDCERVGLDESARLLAAPDGKVFIDDEVGTLGPFTIGLTPTLEVCVVRKPFVCQLDAQLGKGHYRSQCPCLDGSGTWWYLIEMPNRGQWYPCFFGFTADGTPGKQVWAAYPWFDLKNVLEGTAHIAVDRWGNMYVGVRRLNSPDELGLDHSVAVRFPGVAAGTREGAHADQTNPEAAADAPTLAGPVSALGDGAGGLTVLEWGRSRVVRLKPDGEVVSSWGKRGSGDGEFEGPYGLAVDAAGNTYVADTGNNRVQKFGADGTFVAKWGFQGNGDGQFNAPGAVAVDAKGDVYVSDTGNHRVQRFTGDGKFVRSYGSPGDGDGQLRGPLGVAIDGDGNVWVVDSSNSRVARFRSSGEFSATWGEPGSGEGQLKTPYGIAVSPSGEVYVADVGNDRVEEFSTQGKFMRAWAKGDKGPFRQPYGVWLQADGTLLVADTGNNRLQTIKQQ